MHWLIPHSKPGWAAAWLVAGVAGCFAFMQALVIAGQTGGDTLMDNPWLGFAGIAGAMCAIGALIAGMYAMINGDNSAPVWIGVILGLTSVLFLVGEFMFPH